MRPIGFARMVSDLAVFLLARSNTDGDGVQAEEGRSQSSA